MFHNNQISHFRSIGKTLLYLGCVFAIAASSHAQTTSIAFLSCIDDQKPKHPIWKALLGANPDVTVFMGDNVYLDLSRITGESATKEFEANYTSLEETPQFNALRTSSRILAIWDDNDYGQRDGDGSFEYKELSKQKFLEFWDVEPSSARAQRVGNYDSAWIGEGERRIQIILSDTRYFRSAWTRDPDANECASGNIVPSDDEHATMLGEAQWSWLEKRLEEPAALHIFVSGIQVIPVDHCFERWAGFPQERERLIETLSKASARSIILSGDRHLAETSRMVRSDDSSLEIELIEFTSSSFTSRVGFGAGELNRYRVTDDNIRVNNFGLLTVDLDKSKFKVEYFGQSRTVLQEFETTLPIAENEL